MEDPGAPEWSSERLHPPGLCTASAPALSRLPNLLACLLFRASPVVIVSLPRAIQSGISSIQVLLPAQ